MSNKYFNEKVLKEIQSNYPILEKSDKIVYHFNIIDNVNYFYCQIENERINAMELKALLKLNEVKNILKESDISILNYIVHRLTDTQSYYKISNDFSLLFSYLTSSEFPTFWLNEKISFSKENLKLKINIDFDKNNNIILELKTTGEFIFGLDKVFLKKNNTIHKLDNNISLNFYKELALEKNIFSIDNFFKLEKTYLKKLKLAHNITISKEIINLTNLNIKEKIAKKNTNYR